jgi:hypothetical protein
MMVGMMMMMMVVVVMVSDSVPKALTSHDDN